MATKVPRRGDGLADAAGAAPHFFGHRQRLRQRLLAGGADNLPDYELLEVLLFAGNPRGDTKPLAKELIDRFGSLAEVLSADADDLLAFPGLGEAGAAALKSVREAALRLMRAELRERPLLGSWDRLIDYCTANIAYGQVEEFHLLFLDRKNMLIAHERQQRRRSHSGLHPRGREAGAGIERLRADPGAQPPHSAYFDHAQSRSYALNHLNFLTCRSAGRHWHIGVGFEGDQSPF
jgi:hypothetical protein